MIASVDQAYAGSLPNSIIYDGRGGNLNAFFQLEPFDAKILHYDVLKYSSASDDVAMNSESNVSAWPTLRIVIASNKELIVLNNFRMLPGSIKTVDRLLEKPICKLPNDLWALRSSALTD